MVLRTDRRRISIGSAPDNDLVLTDTDVSARHFIILIEEGDWRAQTYSPDQRIVIDRRYSHPKSGRPGALIYAGGTEILLFPGDLDDAAIQTEIKMRLADEVGHRVDSEDIECATRDVTLDVPPQSLARLRPARSRLPSDSGGFGAQRADIPAPDQFRSESPTGRGPVVAPSTRLGASEPIAPSRLRGSEPANEPAAPYAVQAPSPSPEGSGRASRLDPPQLVEAEPVVTPPMGPRPLPVPVQRTNAWGEPVDADGEPVPEEATEAALWGDPVSLHKMKNPSPPPPEPAPQAEPVAQAQAPEAPHIEALHSEPLHSEASAPEDPDASMVMPRGSVPDDRALKRVGFHLTTDELMRLAGDPALTLVREPDGDYSNAIRLFGTRLEELVRTFGYRTYMLSSPEPLTGKTTAACNLAFALAEDPVRRVALIEANFRNPRLGKIFGVPEQQGLIGVLAGQIDVAQAIVKVEDHNLIMFPAGGSHPNPAELLASPRFKTLLAELADTVDIAIIDAPSVKPFADTNLLLPLVDGAMLVVLEGSTKSQWIDQATQQLGRERVLGALYNKVDKHVLRTMAAVRRERLLAARTR